MDNPLTERRLRLDKLLRSIVKERCGEENVYYQPPANLKMKYPCIRYERSRIRNIAADNRVYSQRIFYDIPVIDPQPDSEMTVNLAQLPRISHEQNFTADGLHHDVFSIYY